jgi:hypothetical protein
VRQGRRVGAGLVEEKEEEVQLVTRVRARLCASFDSLSLFLNRGDSTCVYSIDPGGSGAAGAPRAGVATAPRA